MGKSLCYLNFVLRVELVGCWCSENQDKMKKNSKSNCLGKIIIRYLSFLVNLGKWFTFID